MSLLFCTTNSHKFALAKQAFDKNGLKIEQMNIEVDEIQSEDPVRVLEAKAQAMYARVKKPLIVSDDSWTIPALNGFPGPYMKSVNYWFRPEDWINLMMPYDDKRVFLESRAAYIDETGITTFGDIQERVFLDKPSEIDGVSILRAVSLKGMKKPINELWAENADVMHDTRTIWTDFIKWYNQKS